MSQKQLQRYQVVSMAVEGRCTVVEAARALGVSPRQIKRLKRAVRERGAPGVVHGNSQRASPRRTSERLRQRIIRLARSKYKGFNDTHMCEKLQELEGSSLSERPCAESCARKARHRSRRPRHPQQGWLVQLDGSYHDRLNGRGPWMWLHSAIDDATNIVVGGHFEYAENSAGYLRLLRQIVTGHGIPLSVYSDRHGIFQVSRTAWTLQEQLAGQREPTQVARAFKQFGVELILANSPQAKGRIERLFRTLQSRLVSELRLAIVRTLEQANAFLERFLPRFNKRLAQVPAEPQIAYRHLPPSVDIDRICSPGYQSGRQRQHRAHRQQGHRHSPRPRPQDLRQGARRNAPTPRWLLARLPP